jgi:hypothetical protein
VRSCAQRDLYLGLNQANQSQESNLNSGFETRTCHPQSSVDLECGSSEVLLTLLVAEVVRLLLRPAAIVISTVLALFLSRISFGLLCSCLQSEFSHACSLIFPNLRKLLYLLRHCLSEIVLLGTV